MKQVNRENKKGFTLAELLIVVAIIAVLVAISIPLFTAQLEKAKEAVDLSNMRSAKAAALADWMSDSMGSEKVYVYDASKGQAFISGTVDDPAGYGKSSKSASEFAGELNGSGYPKKDGEAAYITVFVDKDGTANLVWGGGNMSYLSAITPYKNQTLMDLKEMPNEQRVAADQTTLKAIGEELLKQNLTLQQFKDKYGIYEEGNQIRIANYYQDKSGSFANGESYAAVDFRMDITDDFASLLSAVGYDGGSSASSANTDDRYKDSTDVISYTNSLFYSDELSTNKFHNYGIDKTMRSIILKDIKTDNNGVIKSFTIYTKAMNGEANMNDEEKAKFSFTVTK